MNRKSIIEKIMAVAAASTVAVSMSCAPVLASVQSGSIVKEETVYVITDSSGNETEKIVSDHLVNDNNDTVIKDKTDLANIENVKGEEKFSLKGDSLEWKAEGNDIYYQGTTSKTSPVTMSVKYYLDGKEISGSKLQGKSGKVKIEIHYSNNTASSGVKVPFVVMTGMMADNATFSNVTIDNGKVLDNGNSTIIVGMAVPGLKDSLGIASDLKLGDSVTIQGDADGFACEDMMTIATSSIFEDIDTGDMDKLNFDDEISQLDEAGSKLVQGSQQLYDGISYMNGNKGTLVSGVSQLNEGASSLSDNTGKALAGSLQLQQGVTQLTNKLSESLAEICSNLQTMSKGAASVQQGLQSINSNITGENGLADTVKKSASSSENAYNNAVSAASAVQAAVNDAGKIGGYISAALDNLDKISTDNMTDEEKDYYKKVSEALKNADNTVKNDLNKNLQAAGNSAQSAAANAKTAQKTSEGVNGALSRISAIIGSTSSEGTLVHGASSIRNGADSMVKVISESTSTGELATGLSSLSQGADQLVEGEKQLQQGASKLAEGMESLNSSTAVLAEGIGQIDAGSKALKDGMAKYYREGISQLVDLYNDELKGQLSSLRSVVNAGKNYTIFSQKAAGTDSSVKFIYKTKISE